MAPSEGCDREEPMEADAQPRGPRESPDRGAGWLPIGPSVHAPRRVDGIARMDNRGDSLGLHLLNKGTVARIGSPHMAVTHDCEALALPPCTGRKEGKGEKEKYPPDRLGLSRA